MKTLCSQELIPMVIGITGHRQLREEDLPALSAAVRGELERLRAEYPHTPLKLLDSLAEGADLLCADVAEALEIPLLAALPMAQEEYEKDFSAEALERFRHHCARAEQVFVTPPAETDPSKTGANTFPAASDIPARTGIPAGTDRPSGKSVRNFAYRQAGIYISTHCHVLLALWDGGPGKKAACGTADAVDFVLKCNYVPATGAPIRSESNEAVIHVFTPRGERTQEAAGTVHILGNRDAVRDVLQKTDEFNRSALALSANTKNKKDRIVSAAKKQRTASATKKRLTASAAAKTSDKAEGTPRKELTPAGSQEEELLSSPESPSAEREVPDPIREQMHAVQQAAGAMSMQAAKQFKRTLSLLAVTSALLTFAFLMYDEAQAIWMILVCGVMIGLAWGLGHFARKSDCHRRYIEYRALAEVLRVQYYLRYAGSRIEAASLLSWTQQEETAWILDALCALSIGPAPQETHDICPDWVDGQYAYHVKATGTAQKKLRVSERTVQIALYVSVTMYLAAVAFELLSGGLFFTPCLPVADAEVYRTVLKILLGTISAMTLFVAGYYGKLSLPRVLSDHQKMARFYKKMSALLKTHGQTEELLTVLAREELIENGNWVSYQRDNTPDMSV